MYVYIYICKAPPPPILFRNRNKLYTLFCPSFFANYSRDQCRSMNLSIQQLPDLFQSKHILAAHLIILQGHEIVVDVFISCILLYPGFKLFMIKYFSTIFQDKGVSGKTKKETITLPA